MTLSSLEPHERPAVTSPPGFMEHRWGRRIPCGSSARIATSAGKAGIGRLRDVSSSGAFAETALDIPLFALVWIKVERVDASAPHRPEIPGIVVRRAQDGLGIEWCETASACICANLGCTLLCEAAREPC